MTTSTTFSVVDHTSDAGFRAWGAEFHAQLLACGLTQTADTGQINWTTVTRPGAGVMAGYEVWRFNDTLQSTVPVFLKFEFGTGLGSVTAPTVKLTLCGATNGAGSAVGFSYTVFCGTNAYNTPPASTTTFYPSRFCYNATLGFFGFAWKIGANTDTASVDSAYQAAFVFRSNNSAGAATGDTVMILSTAANQAQNTSSSGLMICMNSTMGVTYPTSYTQAAYWSVHPLMLSSTIVSGQLAVDPVFFMTPAIGITNSLARALKTEVPMSSQVSLTLVGLTAHNYIQVGNVFGSHYQIAYTGIDAATMTNTNIGLLMLWE